MDYNEMKITWDSQNENPVFQINEATLYKNVTEESIAYGQVLKSIQCIAILTLFGLCGIALNKSFKVDDKLFYFITAGITFSSGAYQAWRLWLRNKFEISFDDSIQGILKKSISRVDYLISLIRSMVWWFVLPMFTIAGLKFYLLDSPKALIGFAALFVVFTISFLASRHEIRSKHLPIKRSFQSLLNKLQEK